MASKKTFSIPIEWMETFNALPDDKAGTLIKHIFAFVSGKEIITEDMLVNTCFINMKKKLKPIEIKTGEAKVEAWKVDYSIYQAQLQENYFKILTPDYINERQKYHPGLDIRHSINKAIKDYWNTPAGWKNKKASKSNEIDWRATFNNALSLKCNQVWEQKNKTTIANNSSAINEAVNLLNEAVK